jgi:DNA repair exonuclease SbcCD ATPase subunit
VLFDMSENLKDLINKAEEEEKTQAQLEKTVENLELKVAKLETKLKENQSSSKLELVKPTTESIESGEIDILKNLINSQNQELSQRNREKEALQQKIKNLNDELISMQESLNDDIRDEVIIKTQNSLNNLIEDYGRLENINIKLKEKISETKTENERLLESAKTIKAESSNVDQLEEDTYRLRKQLSDLEEVNKILEDYNLSLKSKELSVDNLEITIQNLENLNRDVKEENKILTAKLNTVKAERFRLTRFEVKASNLEKEVQALQKANEKLKQSDAILLAKTINVMETQIKESPKTPEKFVPQEPLFEEKVEVKIEDPFKVENIFEEPLEQKPKSDLIRPSNNNLEMDTVSEPEEKSLENEMLKEETVTRKKTCPNCGNTNKSQIREFDDKTKIIYMYPRIYGKMYRCGQCGTEWR